MLALCLWREARGERHDGMVAVGCVVRNRVEKRKTTYYTEVTRPLQFSSITASGDRQLQNFPGQTDDAWQEAQAIAEQVIGGQTADVTHGATLYYADSIPFPKTWNPAVIHQTVKIGHHIFFAEE